MFSDMLARYLADKKAENDIWAGIANLGVIAALLPEEAGGFGGGGFDIATVFEQMGYALLREPLLATLVAMRLLDGRALPDGVLDGSRIASFALGEPQSGYSLSDVETIATPSNGSWQLNGRKSVVPYLDRASLLVVSARLHEWPGDEARIGLFLVEADEATQARAPYPTVDGGAAGELTMVNCHAELITDDGRPVIERAAATGIVALSWEAVGLIDRLLKMTFDHLRTRQQFGQPIGQLQALRHRVATLALEAEQARSAAINAAASLDSSRESRERAVSAAKYTIGRIGALVAEEAIQLHGAIGMTWELPLAHYAKRLIMIDHELGDEDHHLARFAALSAMPL